MIDPDYDVAPKTQYTKWLTQEDPEKLPELSTRNNYGPGADENLSQSALGVIVIIDHMTPKYNSQSSLAPVINQKKWTSIQPKFKFF